MQTRVIDGFEVAMLDGDFEPRIHDLELGRRIELSRPRDIRRVVKQWHDAGCLVDTRCEVRSQSGTLNPRMQCADSRTERVDSERTGRGRGEPAHTEYYLGEADTLFIITKCKTSKATEITKQIIQVFIAWRRGQLAQPKTDPAIAQALTAIHEEVKAVRVLTTHIAQAVGIPLPQAIAREAKMRRRGHHSLEKHPGILMHVEHLFELGHTYSEIIAAVERLFHLRLSRTSLSRYYQRWTVHAGRTLGRITFLPVR